MSSSGQPVETSIRNKLHKTLEATHLEIINESHLHGAPLGSETHFKVVIVSKKFEDLPSLKRHKLVNDTLREEIRTSIRALSIVAHTPDHWSISEEVAETSPKRRSSFGVSYNKMNNEQVARWP